MPGVFTQLATVVWIVAPVFILITVGYAASRTGQLRERAAEGLSEYVFGIGVPVLIFKTLAEARLPEGGQPWGYWTAYFAGAFVAFGIGMLAARRLFGRDRAEAVVQGFASGQANTIFVGVPLILQAFGPEGAVPLFLLIAIHLPVMMVVATVFAEGAAAGLSAPALKRLVRALALNPILIGIYAGGLAQFTGLAPSGLVKQILDMVASSAVPCALISLGLALHRYPIHGDLGPAGLITVLKLVLHPLVVFLLARILPMPPVWANVAVAFAAMPCGLNAYLLAQRYHAGVAASASAISLSTLASPLTVTLWFLALGVG